MNVETKIRERDFRFSLFFLIIVLNRRIIIKNDKIVPIGKPNDKNNSIKILCGYVARSLKFHCPIIPYPKIGFSKILFI